MLKRLRLKFIIINMGIVTVMLCLMLATVLHFTELNLERSSLSMLHAMSVENGRPGRPGERQEQIRLPFFTVDIGNNGSMVIDGYGSFDLSDEELIQALINASRQSEDSSGIIRQYNLRYLRISTPMGERIIFSDMSSELSTMRSLQQSCLVIGILSFIAFLGISILLAHWAVRPVEEAWMQQKQFVADASHELKTPLTVIMANAEFLQEEGYDENARRGFSESILTMSSQMRALVEALLDLARVDVGAARRTFEQLDLSQLAADALLPFEALFFERGLQLESSIAENIHVKGSARQLRQVIEILLDNACKYSVPPGRVELSLCTQGRQAMLSVSSPGEQISPEDLKNIFKRFYRLDEARSRTGSFGLGLSIAQSIVDDHRGKIWAESSGGVNVFHVQLPL